MAKNSFIQETGWLKMGGILTACFCLAGAVSVEAQPTLVSTVPVSGASGVSTTAGVVFTFSTAMDTNATAAQFLSFSPFGVYTTTASWSAGNTVLTCTPVSPFFPNNTAISWFVDGEDTEGTSLDFPEQGTFTTGTSGGGSGTNATTTFSAGKIHAYEQTSTNAATLDPTVPYAFTASTALASNRTASAVNLTLPTAVTTNLTQAFGHPENFNLFASSTNLSVINSNYPSGNYTFVLQPSNSLTAIVNLPASLAQPGVPRVSNFPATQTVNPTQPFQLTWDAFPGGSVTDYVSVVIGGVFQTANPGLSNALNGTATSVTIPANTLAPNTNYPSTLSFYRVIVNTNNPNYTTLAFLGTATDFVLLTGSGITNSLVLTNWAVSNGVFSFDADSAANLTIRIDFNTNLALTNWTTLTNANSGTGRVRITDSQSVSNRTRFYRGRIGP